MFERNKIDNVEHAGVPVELTMADGAEFKGKLIVPKGRNLFEFLNGAGGFVEFEPYGGDRIYLAKAAIRDLRIITVPRAHGLDARVRDDSFDPHTVLGVAAKATFEEIKAAYLKLTKRYHPDLYTNMELPSEVHDYLAAMARRVNLAFAALEAPHQSARRVAVQRSTPIYESAPTAAR